MPVSLRVVHKEVVSTSACSGTAWRVFRFCIVFSQRHFWHRCTVVNCWNEICVFYKVVWLQFSGEMNKSRPIGFCRTFLSDVRCQILLKSVDIRQSYSNNERETFWNSMYVNYFSTEVLAEHIRNTQHTHATHMHTQTRI